MDYKVIQTDEVVHVNNKLCYGSIDYDNLIIKLKNEYPEQKKIQTLWHEIVHGIIREYKISEDCDSETLVDTLATGIVQVLKDNITLTK